MTGLALTFMLMILVAVSFCEGEGLTVCLMCRARHMP